MDQATPESMGEQPETAQEGGYCIQICVMADGSITVESGPLGEGEPTGTPVESIDQAIEQAREIYSQSDAGNKNFNEGYGKQEATPMMVRVREGE